MSDGSKLLDFIIRFSDCGFIEELVSDAGCFYIMTVLIVFGNLFHWIFSEYDVVVCYCTEICAKYLYIHIELIYFISLFNI